MAQPLKLNTVAVPPVMACWAITRWVAIDLWPMVMSCRHSETYPYENGLMTISQYVHIIQCIFNVYSSFVRGTCVDS